MNNINYLIENILSDNDFTNNYAQQTLRKLINSEYDAIKDYQNCLYTFKDDEHATKVIQDIMNEEKVHVRELDLLLKRYDSYYTQAVQKAKQESKEK